MPVPNPFAGLFGGQARPGDEDLLDDGEPSPVPPRPEVIPEPKPGDDVLHGGERARVVLVHPPGGGDAVLDLVVYRGRSAEVVHGVRHDFASGWGWPWEAPPPPPTLGQKLAALRKAGVRIPRVGDTVVSVWASGLLSDHPDPYQGHRARVLEIQGVQGDRVEVRLDLFEHADPPADPLAPDPLIGLQRHRISGPLGEEDRREGWAWPGWKSPRRLTDAERMPRSPCTRCRRPWPHQLRVAIYAAGQFGGRTFANHRHSDAIAHLCGDCAEAVFQLATTAPAVAESPAA